MSTEFRHALERKELSTVYQAIHRVDSGALIGAEALMRWKHPHMGDVKPNDFIPVSERDGSILAPGAWMVAEALTALSGWRSKKPSAKILSVAVNLSPAQLIHGGFQADCEAMLARHKMSRDDLHLELTETSLVDLSQAGPQISALHQAGFQLAIDDFGTGFSSLAYVHKLPFRMLKVDRSFVQDVPHVREARVIVTSVVQLAHDLRMEVVAEGVETAEQLQFLKGIGCDYCQGYLFGRPVPSDEFMEIL